MKKNYDQQTMKKIKKRNLMFYFDIFKRLEFILFYIIDKSSSGPLFMFCLMMKQTCFSAILQCPH